MSALLDYEALGGRPVWQSRAACAGKGPDLFFSETKGRYTDSDGAKAICATCVVRLDCLAFALSVGNSLTGIWGGYTQRERSKGASRRRAYDEIRP